jgi:hypothetical protein
VAIQFRGRKNTDRRGRRKLHDPDPEIAEQ